MFKRELRMLLKGRASKLSPCAIAAFFLTLVLCSFIIVITIVNRSNVEKLQMDQIIMDKSMKISEVISKLLYKTETLAALVAKDEITQEYFNNVAATIVDDPAILNVLIAPDGVVSAVYPTEGNEAVLGLDFLAEGAGNKEAVMAIETGRLVFGGPFKLVQGGEALVGRLPVYTNTEGKKHFWGLVSVTLKYPQALDGVGLNILEAQGFSYELWRYNPDTGDRQVIASSNLSYHQKARFIEKEISILDTIWYFRVAPVRMWFQYTETWLLVFVSLLISLLVAFVMQNNHELLRMKTEIEHIAQTDYMTGLINRRHFMDVAPRYLERARKQNDSSYIILFDIDYFKNINDKYGHDAGDHILVDVAKRVESSIRAYDLLSRFGGEEFVLFASALTDTSAKELAERLLDIISSEKFVYGTEEISVTASFGVAYISDSLEAAIKKADLAMYQAKSDGRNKVKVYE